MDDRLSPRSGERGAILAVAGVSLVTVGWWCLALWPVGGATPDWLARVRSVCFGTTETGLPDASGWMMLVGQPIGMFALVWAIWRGSLQRIVATIFVGLRGAVVVGGLATVGLAAAMLVGYRVTTASSAAVTVFPQEEFPAATYPRVDREAPEFALIDQHGTSVSLEEFRGRPVIVTFGFGHCGTICPMQVHNAVEAAVRSELDPSPALLVLTLDPWRDTPPRLPELAARWGIEGEGMHLLSGPIEEVERALDAWNIPRSRNELTGDIVHPALAYVVDPGGRVAYALQGETHALVELVERAADSGTR